LVRWSKRRAATTPTAVETIAQRIDLGLSLTTSGSLPEGEVAVLAREVQIGCTQGMLAALGETERLAYLVGAILGASDVVGAELLETTPEAFRQRLSRARARMQPVLEARCGLTRGTNPCSCARQAAAKQRAEPITMRFVDAVALSEATEELGELLSLGKPFRESPALGAPRAVWERVLASFPRLTGPNND
jgi:hypothetical protein